MVRYYDIDPHDFPSVTSVLDTLDKGEGLLKWVADKGYAESRRIFQEKGNYGRALHEAFSKWIGLCKESRGLVSVAGESEFASQLGKLQTFCKQNEIDWNEEVYSEYRIHSLRYGYAGTLDLCAVFKRFGDIDNPGRLVLDLKTSNALRETTALQTVAYMIAYNERNPKEQAQGRGAIHINDNGEVKAKVYKRDRDISDFMGFYGLLEAFKWNNKGHYVKVAKETTEKENG